jgi:hypothetical protein
MKAGRPKDTAGFTPKTARQISYWCIPVNCNPQVLSKGAVMICGDKQKKKEVNLLQCQLLHTNLL